jgi:hypothetical protein
VRALAGALLNPGSILFRPLLACFSRVRVIASWFQAGWKTLRRAAVRVPSAAFWQGSGYLMDSAHGGLMTFFAIPRKVLQELELTGFRLMRILGDDYPRPSHVYSTDWFYYVFAKSEALGEK